MIKARLLLLCFLVLGSDQAFAQPLVKTLSPQADDSIQRLLQQVHFDVVDLDAAAVKDLAPTRMIGSDESDDASDILIGAPMGIDVSEETLIIADYVADAVLFSTGSSTRVERSLGSRGNGPGEFANLVAATIEGDFTFAADEQSFSVVVFDANGDYVTDLEAGLLSWNSIDSGHGRLALPSGSGDTLLVDLRSTSPPFELVQRVLPRITDKSDPASDYNLPIVGMNTAGELVAAYEGLPILLFFDSFGKLSEIIVLRSDSIAARDNIGSMSNGKYSIRSFILGLDLSDAGNVILSCSGGVYLLSRRAGPNRIPTRLRLSDNGDLEADEMIPFDLAFDGKGGFFAASIFKAQVYHYDIWP